MLDEILESLPGNLGWNRLETGPLSVTPWSFTHFVDRHVSPGVQDWSKGKVLCRRCVLKFIGGRAFDSLRDLKAQRGSSCPLCCDIPENINNRIFHLDGPPLRDCWYGYRCRTQRKEAHAARLNVCTEVLIPVMLV
jgi:hypothetical protein